MYEKLLEPITVGGVKFKNHIVKPGQGMRYGNTEGTVTERLLNFYEAIARGGVGMVTLEVCCVSYPEGMSGVGHMRIDDDKFISGLTQMAQTIHKYNTPAFIQLGHSGPRHPQALDGAQPLAASELTEADRPEVVDRDYTATRAATVAEIEGIVLKFGRAAGRAKKAGFDGVEIHSCHDYFVNSFLSRAFNHRNDAYGPQDMKSRTKLLVDIIKAIKSEAGPNFPVGVRLNAAELGIKNGVTPEENHQIAKIAEEAGIAYVHLSAYGYGKYTRLLYPEQILYPEAPSPLDPMLDGSHRGAGILLPMATALKKVINVPVISVGRYNPDLAEQALREGKTDLIAIGRGLLTDPELPNKLASGRADEIRPCMACLECRNKISLTQGVQCRGNAAMGREKEMALTPAEKKKKVLVVGAGPAGMEAARVAALRGHQVVLYDRQGNLGGLIPLAAMVKGFDVEQLPPMLRFFKVSLNKLGVQLRLGTDMSESVLAEVKPDVVIVANGGLPAKLDIPGVDRKNVLSTEKLHKQVKGFLKLFGPELLRSLTKIWMPIGKSVIIVGGGIQGCEMAEFLVKRGRKVTIVEATDKLGEGMVELNRVRLIKWLTHKGVTQITSAKFEEVTDKGLVITNKEGKKQTIEAESVALATGMAPNNLVLKMVEGKVPEVFQIGDSKEPGLIINAIHAGYQIARNI